MRMGLGLCGYLEGRRTSELAAVEMCNGSMGHVHQLVEDMMADLWGMGFGV